jgi:hypothetical protein
MIKLAVHALLLAIPWLITGLAVGAQMDEAQLRRSGFLGVQVGRVTDDRASSGDLQVKSDVPWSAWWKVDRQVRLASDVVTSSLP